MCTRIKVPRRDRPLGVSSVSLGQPIRGGLDCFSTERLEQRLFHLQPIRQCHGLVQPVDWLGGRRDDHCTSTIRILNNKLRHIFSRSGGSVGVPVGEPFGSVDGDGTGDTSPSSTSWQFTQFPTPFRRSRVLRPVRPMVCVASVGDGRAVCVL